MGKQNLKYISTILVPLFLILAVTLAAQLYKQKHRYNLTAKFEESGPLHKNMPVYYKGYHIGKTQNVEPSKDYKYTLVKIILFPKSPKLPENIVAKVKRADMRKDYINLQGSADGSTAILKSGSTIDGEPAFDLEGFLSDIADSDLIIPLLQTFSDTLISVDKAGSEIKNFFSSSNGIIKENRKNIRQTSKNLVTSSKSLTSLTSRINNKVDEEFINNSINNVNKASDNIITTTESLKSIGNNVDKATKNLDKTMGKIDCTVTKANKIADNVDAITCGLRSTLGTRFAGAKIIFGKPIKNDTRLKNCSK